MFWYRLPCLYKYSKVLQKGMILILILTCFTTRIYYRYDCWSCVHNAKNWIDGYVTVVPRAYHPCVGWRGIYRGGTSPSRDRLPNVNDANVIWFVLITLVQTWGVLDPSTIWYGQMKRWKDDHGNVLTSMVYDDLIFI